MNVTLVRRRASPAPTARGRRRCELLVTAVLLARTRWGRIVRHEDFYEDTQRIAALETRLSELGVRPTG
jgi:hypothetical protein